MTDHHNQREAIARIIDHEGYWERLDNLNAVIRAGIASDDQHMELCHKRDEEIAGTEESLSKADQIIAMQSQGREPVGFYCPTYLSRRKEYERNGMVIYDRPLGTSTSPLYAQPDRREVEVLRGALDRLEQFARLDDEDKHSADNAEDRQFYTGRANGLRTAVNFIRGCGAIDCVNHCDGDFTHETCPNAQADAIAREGEA